MKKCTRSFLALLAASAAWCSGSTAHGQTTLPNALDATNLVWTTGGTGGVGWFYETQDIFGSDNTFDGVDSARSGHILDNGETWIQTVVVGPGTLSFWWNAYSEPEADWLEFYVNSDLRDRISGVLPAKASGWHYRSFALSAGTNTLKWRYVKDGSLTGATLDSVWVDQVAFVASSPPPPLQQALNTCGVAWTSGGNTNPTTWFAQPNITREGGLAAQSGAIYHNQTNWLQTAVTGVTNVSFWWKVSSQTNADFLEFHTNGVLAKRISGEVNWQSNYFKLAPGANTLTWLYRRDASFTAGSNCGWLDQVTFSPAPKALPYALGSPKPLADGSMELAVMGEAGCNCRILLSTNLATTNWTALTDLTTTSASTRVLDPAASNSPVRFYRAQSL